MTITTINNISDTVHTPNIVKCLRVLIKLRNNDMTVADADVKTGQRSTLAVKRTDDAGTTSIRCQRRRRRSGTRASVDLFSMWRSACVWGNVAVGNQRTVTFAAGSRGSTQQQSDSSSWLGHRDTNTSHKEEEHGLHQVGHIFFF